MQMFVIPLMKGVDFEPGSVEGPLMTDEAVCLDAPDRDDPNANPRVKIMACSGQKRQMWRYTPQVNIILIPFVYCYELLLIFRYQTRNGRTQKAIIIRRIIYHHVSSYVLHSEG